MSESKKQFRVKTKGFTETYYEEAKAEKMYETQKARRERKKEPFKITLETRDDKEKPWRTIEECTRGRAHFDE